MPVKRKYSKKVQKLIKRNKTKGGGVKLAKRKQNIQCRTKRGRRGMYTTCYDTVSGRQLRRASARKKTGRKRGRPKKK